MEGLLETQIRERRLQIWNNIQTMYIIPTDVQKAIRRWIMFGCNYVPRITLAQPIARVALHEDT
jgi:hypothetical protein